MDHVASLRCPQSSCNRAPARIVARDELLQSFAMRCRTNSRDVVFQACYSWYGDVVRDAEIEDNQWVTGSFEQTVRMYCSEAGHTCLFTLNEQTACLTCSSPNGAKLTFTCDSRVNHL